MTEIKRCIRRLVDGQQTHTRACTYGTAKCDLTRKAN